MMMMETAELQAARRLAEEHLTGGAKFTEAHLAQFPVLAEAARQYARTYTGTFGYMNEMHRAEARFGLSPAQARGVLNCWLAEDRRGAAQGAPAAPAAEPPAPTAPALAPAAGAEPVHQYECKTCGWSASPMSPKDVRLALGHGHLCPVCGKPDWYRGTGAPAAPAPAPEAPVSEASVPAPSAPEANAWVGTVGEPVTLQATVTATYLRTRDARQGGGAYTVVKLADAAGHQLVWFAPGDQTALRGRALALTGTVRGHTTYGEARETQLARVTIQ